MNSCLCDSLSSKLLFHVIFLLFYPPFIPIPAGREIGFLQRNTIEFLCCKRNQFTCFVSSESVSSSSGNTFQNKKQKNSGWHTCSQARVFTCGDVLLKEKNKNKKKTISLTLLGYNLSVRLLTEALCVFLIPSFTLLRFHLGLLLGEMSITLPSRCYFCGFAFEKHLQAAIIRVHEYEVVGNGRLITNSDQTQSYTVNILNTIVILFRFFQAEGVQILNHSFFFSP